MVRRRDPGIGDGRPQVRGGRVGDRNLDACFARVAGAGNHARRALPAQLADLEASDCSGLGEDGRQLQFGLRSLHRQHGAIVRCLLSPDRGADTIGVGCIGHDVEHFGVDPPHDDVVEHGGIDLVEQMRVLGTPRRDLVEVIGERELQPLVGIAALDTHGAEV